MFKILYVYCLVWLYLSLCLISLIMSSRETSLNVTSVCVLDTLKHVLHKEKSPSIFVDCWIETIHDDLVSSPLPAEEVAHRISITILNLSFRR